MVIPRPQADISRRIQVWRILRANGITDAAGHIHAPKGSPIGGRFVAKLLSADQAAEHVAKARSSPDHLSTLKVAELSDIAGHQGIPRRGTKAQLVERVGAHARATAPVKAAKAAETAAKATAPRPAGGGAKNGVRDALAEAGSTRAVARVFSTEMARITGRPLPQHMIVDFEGSDVQIAREHSEGILRGLERYPDTNLAGVRMGNLPEGIYAQTLTGNGDVSSIVFSHDAQRYGERSYRADLRQKKSLREQIPGTPMGVAMHEFGHAVTIQSDTVGVTHRHGVHRISRYAASSEREAAAEAFADVLLNAKPKPESKAFMAEVDAAIHPTGRQT